MSSLNPAKPYTVVGLCVCGCESPLVVHVTALDAQDARLKADRQSSHNLMVVEVFDGHLKGVL